MWDFDNYYDDKEPLFIYETLDTGVWSLNNMSTSDNANLQWLSTDSFNPLQEPDENYLNKNIYNDNFQKTKTDKGPILEAKSKCDTKEPEKKSRIRKKFSIKPYKRKLYSDAIRKKIKVNFLNKFVISRLNEALSLYFPGSNLKFNKLPQPIVTNLSIKENSQLIENSIRDLFSEKIIINKFSKSNDEFHNKMLITSLLNKENKSLNSFITNPIKEIFKIYITDKIFEKHINEIMLKNGKEYYHLYNQLSQDFIAYYTITKSNNRREKKK